MSLLGPLPLALWAYAAAGAAALAVGAYIIKMRRRRFEVPFAQLWQRVLDQKDASALWKQLRRLLSLVLVLLILGLVLFAALDPTLGAVDRRARSVVILLDASASMKATDGDPAPGAARTRLEVAKRQARAVVDGMGGGDVAMIVKVDGQATPLSRFTSDGPALDAIIDGIAASDTPADLPRALGAAADALRDRPNPLVVLVSDGAFPAEALGRVTWAAAPGGARDLAAVDLAGLDVRYVPVGHRSDNVGIVAFDVRRYVANKAAYEVYLEVQNFGAAPATRQLTLYNGDSAVDRRTLTLAPGKRERAIYAQLPAGGDHRLRATLRPVEAPGAPPGATVDDPFPLDDEAYALLPARKRQKVLMVTLDNLYLEGALLVYDDVEPAKLTPAEYDANPALAEGYDAVIFDEHTPKVLPPPPAGLLFFHPTGPDSPFRLRGAVERPRITETDEAHPVMRWVTLSDVNFDRSEVFAPDPARGEQALAYAVRDPIVVARREAGRKLLGFGFSLPAAGRPGATDLPLRVAFPLLLVNALDWFAGEQADRATTFPTGERARLPLDGVVGATEAEVTGPGGAASRVPVLGGLATFYGARVGFYDVAVRDAAGAPLARVELAANLASPAESNIAPAPRLSLGGRALAAPEAFAITRSRRLWTYLVLLAALLIGLEWVTYHRRITV